ncbi:S-type anion channel SLAH3 [Apostasia shenzhenica]|uniref:S-type anion channel SLAH3 n=1 Tax=Apostasia shenzhenica TaxID=1088818 RepID=A0A2I0B7A0_9ASPA|nr:S-type anion channel SLAH3 [Apostasia shenzhenica]
MGLGEHAMLLELMQHMQFNVQALALNQDCNFLKEVDNRILYNLLTRSFLELSFSKEEADQFLEGLKSKAESINISAEAPDRNGTSSSSQAGSAVSEPIIHLAVSNAFGMPANKRTSFSKKRLNMSFSTAKKFQKSLPTHGIKYDRYKSFKTWSRKIARQINDQNKEINGPDDTKLESLPAVERYFAALDGPELEVLRASEGLVFPEDQTWPFLLRFPISSFGMCLGVGSQAILWKTLATAPSMDFLNISINVNLILWCISLALLSLVAFIYVLKIIFYFEAVKREYYHPVRVNFFFAPWVTCLFLAIGLPQPIAEHFHTILWYVLMAPILCLELKIYGQWMLGGDRRLSKVANPSNHLAVVGNFVGAMLGASVGLKDGPIFFFAVGLAHYVVLFVTLYQRLPTNESLPKDLHPVFFLFIAAPNAASVAWAMISGSFGPVSRISYFTAMFLYASLAVRINFFRGFKFSLAWWAYTFPMTSAGVATINYANDVNNVATRSLAVALSAISTIIVLALLISTILHAFVFHDLFPNDCAIAIMEKKLKSKSKSKAKHSAAHHIQTEMAHDRHGTTTCSWQPSDDACASWLASGKYRPDNQMPLTWNVLNKADIASKVLDLPEDEKWPFLLRFPISSFGMCLGVGSQAMLWKTLATSPSMTSLNISINVNLILWCTSLALLSIVASVYVLKIIFYFEAVRREYYHPVRVNFFFAPWIACLFLGISLPPHIAENLRAIFWYVLMTPIGCLELKIYGQWMSGGERKLSKVANVSNHLAVVGNFVGALLGASSGLKEGPVFFFAVGLAHYIVLFVTLYQRLPTNKSLPKDLHPVFFLFIAAPNAASVAWATITGSFSMVSRITYFMALFLFSLAWWAYTFPMASAAIATIKFANDVDNFIIKKLAIVLSAISTITVLALLISTILHALVFHDLFPNDAAILVMEKKTKSKPKKKHSLYSKPTSNGKNMGARKSQDNEAFSY